MTEFSTQVQRQELVDFNILHKSYTIYLMQYCGPKIIKPVLLTAFLFHYRPAVTYEEDYVLLLEVFSAEW